MYTVITDWERMVAAEAPAAPYRRTTTKRISKMTLTPEPVSYTHLPMNVLVIEDMEKARRDLHTFIYEE